MCDFEQENVSYSSGDEGSQIKEVYAYYGLAMYHAQVLEHGMVNSIVILDFLQTLSGFKSKDAWDRAFDDFLRNNFKKTFGQLLPYVMGHQLPAPLASDLECAKRARNYLAHGFFRENALNFITEGGRRRMIMECENNVALFEAVDGALELHVKSKRDRFGVSDQMIETWTAKLEAQARAQEPDLGAG